VVTKSRCSCIGRSIRIQWRRILCRRRWILRGWRIWPLELRRCGLTTTRSCGIAALYRVLGYGALLKGWRLSLYSWGFLRDMSKVRHPSIQWGITNRARERLQHSTWARESTHVECRSGVWDLFREGNVQNRPCWKKIWPYVLWTCFLSILHQELAVIRRKGWIGSWDCSKLSTLSKHDPFHYSQYNLATNFWRKGFNNIGLQK